MIFAQLSLVACLLVRIHCTLSNRAEKVEKFLKEYNEQIVLAKSKFMEIKFREYSNSTEYNSKQLAKATKDIENKSIEYRNQARLLDTSDSDDHSKRQLNLLSKTITPSNSSVLDELIEKRDLLMAAFTGTTIPYKKEDETIEMSGEQYDTLLRTLDDESKLLNLWQVHRNSIGRDIPKLFSKYVELNNIGARENGYSDAGEFKRSAYEDDNLEHNAGVLWSELETFYELIHAYVRYVLMKKYPDNVTDCEPIPAHLMRSVDTDTWHNLYKLTVPYPDEPSIDVSKNIEKKLSAIDMFKIAENFFVSIGWKKLPNTFWKRSVLVKPKDRSNIFCHGTAWDMMRMDKNEQDLRLILCALPSQEKLLTIHHELGHLYYASKYWDLPYEFREGANPAFHEAVGDTLTLSTQTPEHLHKIGLLDDLSHTDRTDINFLFKTALETVVFLPYAYILEKWIWNVYNGKIEPESYNKAWWEMRYKYQGIKSPTDRPDHHMDMATKYHIVGDVPFSRYFFSIFLQFTFHKHGCKASKFEGPLHKCSIYNSTEAGKAFGDMLALGRSRPWPEVLKTFTGSEKLTAQPILEYFAPLTKWLKEQQQKHGYSVGWKEPKNCRNSNNKTPYIIGFTVLAIAIVLIVILLVLYRQCRKKGHQDKTTAVYAVENGKPLLQEDNDKKTHKISNNNDTTVEAIES